jgi:hypothetical protein
MIAAGLHKIFAHFSRANCDGPTISAILGFRWAVGSTHVVAAESTGRNADLLPKEANEIIDRAKAR